MPAQALGHAHIFCGSSDRRPGLQYFVFDETRGESSRMGAERPTSSTQVWRMAWS